MKRYNGLIMGTILAQVHRMGVYHRSTNYIMPSSSIRAGQRRDARFCLFLAYLVRGNCSVKWDVIVPLMLSVDGV